ncbi:MAG: hypothetical protein ACM3KD_11245 [Hyphomicrobiaceae bacterium]
MQTGRLLVFLAALSLPLAMQPCAADEHFRRPHPGQARSAGRGDHDFRREFRERDTRRFPEHGIGMRHDDHGSHRWHDGGGHFWFFFPGPNPYPDPYYAMPPPLYEAPLDPGYWYYCDDPPGYYPDVAECRRPWHAVVPGDTPPPG